LLAWELLVYVSVKMVTEFAPVLTIRLILVTGGIMITMPLIPLRKRPIFQSFFGIVFGVSSIISPLVGGGFTDNR
jgi:hypothetical protein